MQLLLVNKPFFPFYLFIRSIKKYVFLNKITNLKLGNYNEISSIFYHRAGEERPVQAPTIPQHLPGLPRDASSRDEDGAVLQWAPRLYPLLQGRTPSTSVGGPKLPFQERDVVPPAPGGTGQTRSKPASLPKLQSPNELSQPVGDLVVS